MVQHSGVHARVPRHHLGDAALRAYLLPAGNEQGNFARCPSHQRYLKRKTRSMYIRKDDLRIAIVNRNTNIIEGLSGRIYLMVLNFRKSGNQRFLSTEKTLFLKLVCSKLPSFV